MGFSVFQLDTACVEGSRRLFPDEIDSNEWVMFHGTSGFNAASIERDGFDSTHGVVSPSQIRRVIEVFQKMKWCGDDGGGYPVLKPFSLDHDFQGTDRSLLFFAETSTRALLYATRDHSGGEKLRALRHAFKDLESYLSDPSRREQHHDYLSVSYHALFEVNAHPREIEAVRPVEIDLAWLGQELEDLSDIRRFADDALQRHDHGVVYALRMTPDDVGRLSWNRSMGIEVNTRILPPSIVGKVIVPPDYVMNQHSRTGADLLRRLDRGLLAALRTGNGQY
jgi:hypothetical protein